MGLPAYKTDDATVNRNAPTLSDFFEVLRLSTVDQMRVLEAVRTHHYVTVRVRLDKQIAEELLSWKHRFQRGQKGSTRKLIHDFTNDFIMHGCKMEVVVLRYDGASVLGGHHNCVTTLADGLNRLRAIKKTDVQLEVEMTFRGADSPEEAKRIALSFTGSERTPADMLNILDLTETWAFSKVMCQKVFNAITVGVRLGIFAPTVPKGSNTNGELMDALEAMRPQIDAVLNLFNTGCSFQPRTTTKIRPGTERFADTSTLTVMIATYLTNPVAAEKFWTDVLNGISVGLDTPQHHMAMLAVGNLKPFPMNANEYASFTGRAKAEYKPDLVARSHDFLKITRMAAALRIWKAFLAGRTIKESEIRRFGTRFFLQSPGKHEYVWTFGTADLPDFRVIEEMPGYEQH